MVYDAIERVILDLVWTAVLEETMNNHVAQYFKARKAAEALRKRLLRYEILAPIAILAQSQTPTKEGSTFSDPRPWQPVPRRTPPWQQTPALCTKHRLVPVLSV